MVKAFNRITLILVLFVALTAGIEDDIANAFKAGNSGQLATYFGANIDLTILDEDNLYSKTDATAKLSTFFKSHPVTNFQVLHEGEAKNGLKYVIGSLKTNKGDFRVSYYFKLAGEKCVLQKIIIDSE